MTEEADRPATPILLFSGTGTSAGDVAAFEQLLSNAGLTWSTADSRQLNRRDEAQMRKYRLPIVPGGNFESIGKGLTFGTATRLTTV